MPCVLSAAADIVATELNSTLFRTYCNDLGLTELAEIGSGGITAKRSNAEWDLEVKNAGTLRLDVVGVGHRDSSLEGRGSLAYLSQVDAAVRMKFADSDMEWVNEIRYIKPTSLDPLIWLVEKIHEWMCKKVEADQTWKEAVINAVSNKDLRERGMFVGFVRVTLETSKTLP